MCVKLESEYYKLVLNNLYMNNFVTSSIAVFEVATPV